MHPRHYRQTQCLPTLGGVTSGSYPLPAEASGHLLDQALIAKLYSNAGLPRNGIGRSLDASSRRNVSTLSGPSYPGLCALRQRPARKVSIADPAPFGWALRAAFGRVAAIPPTAKDRGFPGAVPMNEESAGERQLRALIADVDNKDEYWASDRWPEARANKVRFAPPIFARACLR